MRWPIQPKMAPALWLIGLGLLLLGLVYIGLFHWWLVAPGWRDGREMAELRQRQASNAARLALRPELERRLASLQRRQDQTHDFLPDADPSAASAGLMQRLVAGVARHGGQGDCEVTQKIPVPMAETERAAFREVRVTINLRCDPESLAALLYDLEYGHPYIFVTDFVMYQSAPVLKPSAGAGSEIQFTVGGFLKTAVPDASVSTARVVPEPPP